MNKKIIIAFFVVGLFVVAFYLLPSFELNEQVTEPNEQLMYLEQDMEFLEENLFEAEKFIVDVGMAEEYFHLSDEEILFVSVEDERFVILFEMGGESEPEYRLMVRTNESKNSYNSFHIPTFEPIHGITWDMVGYNHRYYTGGIITNKDIKGIEILQNALSHEAEIFPIGEEMYGWYSFFDREDTEVEGRFMVRVFDENGKEMWSKPVEELY